MNKLVLVVCFVLLAGAGFAANDADGKPTASIQFKKAQQILTMADEARGRDDYVDAIKFYRESLDTYTKLSKNYPDWQQEVTQFRIVYCNNQIETLLKKTEEKDFTRIPASGKTNAIATSSESSVLTNTVTNTVLKSTGSIEQPDKANIEVIKSEASALIKKGNIDKARSTLLNGLQIEPDDKNLRMLMGIIHCRLKEYENAIYLTEPLTQEDSTNAIARVILGTAFLGLGKIPEAANQMQEALKINPKLPEAHYNLAQILLAGKPADTNAAAIHYRSALELGAKPDTNLNFLLLELMPAKTGK